MPFRSDAVALWIYAILGTLLVVLGIGAYVWLIFAPVPEGVAGDVDANVAMAGIAGGMIVAGVKVAEVAVKINAQRNEEDS